MGDYEDMMSLRFGLLDHGQDMGVGERLSVSAEENVWFGGADLKSGKDAVEGFSRHKAVLHVPNISHACSASQVAFVGDFHIDPAQGSDRWMYG